MIKTPFLNTPKPIKQCCLPLLIALAPYSLADTGEIEEVTVTGSYIKGTADDTALPVQIMDSEYLESIGAVTIADVINKMAINSGSENQADSFTQGGTQGTSNVNLRGLGLSSTLVLINGRRQTFSGALTNDGSIFVDSSTIPVEALERVEVLKEGASSTYGSDAIAGVVNFILRKDFEGFELNVGYQTVADGDQEDQDIGFVWGFGNDNTHVLIGGHYLDRTPLSASQRPDLVPNAISSLGNTFLPFTDVSVADGPYAGDYLAFENIPQADCESTEGGVLIPQALGARCGFHYGPLYNLVNREIRRQLYANISHDWDTTSMLFEIGVSENDVKDNPQSPSFPDLTFPFISADHPSNPFGTGVLWLGRPLSAGFESPLAPRENDTFRTSFNLTGEFHEWSWDTALTYSENKYTQYFQDTLTSRLRAGFIGLGGPNNDEYFDPFVPSNNSQALIDDFSYVTEMERTVDLLVADAVISGELYEMPAGPIGFAAGVQARSEGFQVDTDDVYEIRTDENGAPIPVDLIFFGGFSHENESRKIYAMFAETQIPLTEDIELTGAIRYEHLQSDDSVDPKLSLRWQMTDNLVLRASASTAFREPSLSQQYASSVTLNGIQDFNEDGTARGGVAFIRVSANGSTDLKPEQSENYNFGIIYEPSESLNLKLDYWQVDYTDLITVENAQGKIFADINGPDIRRDEFGNLIGIDVEFFNSSAVNVNGLDAEMLWTANDYWSGSLNISHFLKYDISLPDGSEVDAAGYFNNNNFVRSLPKTKANANVLFNKGNHSASTNISYISGYDYNPEIVVPATEEPDIGAFTTVDLQYGYNWELNDKGNAVTLTLGAKNVFDEAPPRVYDGANLSYDPKQHSPLGRVYYAKLKYSL